MNVLILGSGGREHAFAWKIAQSNKLTKLFVAPGNAGTQQLASNLNVNPLNFSDLKKAVLDNKIHLVVVGPEDPLVQGVVDFFEADSELNKVLIVGPHKVSAALEGSKDFAKTFMYKHRVPTAAYKSYTKNTFSDACAFLETLKPPYVLKADGLAAGKGVLIIDHIQEAKEALSEMFEGKFGGAGTTVVIEEFLKGIEVSVFVLTDGNNYCILPEAKDYKRIGEGDTGLNTGGMGAVSPVPFADKAFMDKVEERIVKPTINGLKADNLPYKGFVFIGLMNVSGDPYVIEYNVRMGDPETEVVLPRIENDLLEILIATAKGELKPDAVQIKPDAACTVVAVSGGYPEAYEKNKVIMGLNTPNSSIVFHAGTLEKEGNILSNGGRVLAVSSLANTAKEALDKSYSTLKNIGFEGMYYRKDIGKDLVQ